jgi:hypothetical protein
MRRQSAARGIDVKRADVMVGPDRAVPWSGAAARHVEIPPRGVRPGILHAGGQRDRRALDQRRTHDIHVIVRQFGPDISIERDPV